MNGSTVRSFSFDLARKRDCVLRLLYIYVFVFKYSLKKLRDCTGVYIFDCATHRVFEAMLWRDSNDIKEFVKTKRCKCFALSDTYHLRNRNVQQYIVRHIVHSKSVCKYNTLQILCAETARRIKCEVRHVISSKNVPAQYIPETRKQYHSF